MLPPIRYVAHGFAPGKLKLGRSTNRFATFRRAVAAIVSSPIPNRTADAGSGTGVKPAESTENWPLTFETKLFKKPPGPKASGEVIVAKPKLELCVKFEPNVAKSEENTFVEVLLRLAFTLPFSPTRTPFVDSIVNRFLPVPFSMIEKRIGLIA